MTNTFVKAGAKIGAVVGTIVWFLFGILAGFHFGGYSTIILLNKLFGEALEPTLIVRAIIVAGMAVGIATVGSVCLVVGGLLGALGGWLTTPILKEKEQLN